MRPEANLFYASAMISVNAELKNIIRSDAKKNENRNVNKFVFIISLSVSLRSKSHFSKRI